MREIGSVAVIGAGTMGNGIAHVFAVHGHEVRLIDVDGAALERALATDASIIGVNARDLRSFDVDPGRAGQLVERVPPSRVAVFMSGVRTPADFERVADTRADAVLIGEGLMRARDPGAQLADLLRLGRPRSGR